MKKLLASLILLLATAAFASVDSTSMAIWQVKSEQARQNFIKNDNMTRSIAYNKGTNHLLVATRTGGPRIVVLHATTGDSLAQLNISGVSGGTYVVNKVAVAEDGVIYACNFETGSSLKIYRWQSESSAPTVAASLTVTGATQFGDAFNVIGKGVNTRIYIAGDEPNFKSRVAILGTANGLTFTVKTLVKSAAIKATDIFPVDGRTYWLAAPGQGLALYDTTGAKIGQMSSDVVPDAASAMGQFGYFGHYYLAVFDGDQAEARARLVQLGDVLPSAATNAIFTNLGAHGNAEGTGAIVVDPDSDRVFILGSHNSISAFRVGSYAIWPMSWRIKAENADWFGTNNEVRSVAYNPVTRHLYIASRHGGTYIKILDPLNGRVIKDLNNAGISGGIYYINMITATDDGQIFVGNLSISGVNFKLYHWTNEDAAPLLVFDGALDGRVGDALACAGTGRDVEVYASGQDNKKIFVFSATDSSDFVHNGDITLPENSAARYGIAPVNGKDYFFISSPGKPIRYIKRDGTVLYTFNTSEVSGASARFYEVPTLAEISRKFLIIASGYTPGTSVVELFGEDGDNLCSYWEKVPNRTPLYANNANANTAAQAVYELENNQIIELTTNNGLSAYSFRNIEPYAGIPMAELEFSTYQLDFGDVLFPSDPVTKTFWLTNIGTAPLRITRILHNEPIFTTSVVTPLTLNIDDTLKVTVTCTPASPGLFEDALSFVTDIGDFEVDLSINLKSSLCIPIAEARIDADGDFNADLKGQTVTVCGTITTPNYRPAGSQYWMQDETGGINLYAASIVKDLKIGDNVMVKGKIDQYRGLVEIVPAAADDIEILGAGEQLTALPVEKSGLNEVNESVLAEVFRYRLVDASKWPAAGKYANCLITNGRDTINVYIAAATDMPGQLAPAGWFNLIGVIDQFTTSTPADGGYELRPRSMADFLIITGADAWNQQEVPETFALKQNHPNPFNPTTRIVFDAPEPVEVKIKIYDLLGKEVAVVYEGKVEAGHHAYTFSGDQLPSGIYFYRVESAKFVDMKKMTLLK